MNHSIRITLSKLSSYHRIAAPASTLLLTTVIMMALGVMTQIAKGATDKAIYTSAQTSPGGYIDVAIDGPSDQPYSAYLPGLTNVRVHMVYDHRFGFHMGQLPVPFSAPQTGFCTVRIMSDHKELQNIRVPLRSTQAADDS